MQEPKLGNSIVLAAQIALGFILFGSTILISTAVPNYPLIWIAFAWVLGWAFSLAVASLFLEHDLPLRPRLANVLCQVCRICSGALIICGLLRAAYDSVGNPFWIFMVIFNVVVFGGAAFVTWFLGRLIAFFDPSKVNRMG